MEKGTFYLFGYLRPRSSHNPARSLSKSRMSFGPVIYFVSAEQGTLFANLLGHSAFVQDGEVV